MIVKTSNKFAHHKYNGKKIALDKCQFTESMGIDIAINDLILFASPIGHGKTNFLLSNLFEYNTDVRVGYFTTTNDFTFIEKLAREVLSNRLSYIVEEQSNLVMDTYTALRLPTINSIRKAVTEHGLGLVVIDNYVSDKPNYFNPNPQFIAQLKTLTSDLGFNVIFTHSVSESILIDYPNKVPCLNDFIDDPRIFQLFDSIIWTEDLKRFGFDEYENGYLTTEYKRLSYYKSIDGQKETGYVKLIL